MPPTDVKAIRDAFDYDTDQWFKIREAGKEDMLCGTGNVWQAMDPKGLEMRVKRKRPAIELDELGQYVNQLINDIRQNKRAVKVTAIARKRRKIAR
jgi:hypothetical protein